MVDWPVNDDAFEVRSAPARPGLSVIKSVKFDNSGKPEIASSNVCELPHVAMLSTQRAIRSEDFISIEVVDKCATQTEIRSRRRSGNCSGRERQSPAHMLSNVPSVRLKFIAAEGSTGQDLESSGVRGAAYLDKIGLPRNTFLQLLCLFGSLRRARR